MEQLSRGCKSVSILESDLARRLIASELLNGELYYEDRELDVLSKTGSSYTNENGHEIVPSSLPFDSFYTNENGHETVPSSLPLLDMENKATYSKGIAAISKSDDNDKTKTYEFNYKEIKEYCTQAKRTWNFEAKCQSQRKSSNCGKNDISRMELETLRSPMVPSSYIVRKYFELIIERSNGKRKNGGQKTKFIEESGIEDNTEFPTFMDNADYIDASSTEKAIQNLKANIVTKIAKETGNKYTWTNWKETKPENLSCAR
uniref:Uncharacterized protein n=1 Tax=Panagrolaimus superbus TaxID=310955 RepID=A0A914YBG5_9BILA